MVLAIRRVLEVLGVRLVLAFRMLHQIHPRLVLRMVLASLAGLEAQVLLDTRLVPLGLVDRLRQVDQVGQGGQSPLALHRSQASQLGLVAHIDP